MSAELDHAIERLLKRDRMVVLAGLVAMTLLAWAYLITLALRMDMGVSVASMATLKPWTALDAAMMFVMWTVMMIGMMVPSATPMVLLYAHVLRSRAGEAEPLVPTSAFFAGYISVWVGFSAAATLLQWWLEKAVLLSPMMVSTSPIFSGLVLIAAAAYQWTPLKASCLRHCRSPIWYLSTHWRHGVGGAYRMGLQHGAYCLGCCWLLMALLFVGGVMNLLTVAAITIFVLLEKAAPLGRGMGRVGAGILVLSGFAMILFLPASG
jgi:predicted metal-binding membrane protein